MPSLIDHTGEKFGRLTVISRIENVAEEAKKRQQHGLTAPGRPKNASVKNDLSAQPQVRAQVAKQFDVSEGYVHRAQKIKDANEELFQDVKSGRKSMSEAARALKIDDIPTTKKPAAPKNRRSGLLF